MRALPLVALLACACSPAHEVDVTIFAGDTVTTDLVAKIESVEIAILGTEPGSVVYPIVGQFADRKATWIYKAKVDGPLQFEVTARGAAHAFIATGKSQVVTTGARSVSAKVTLDVTNVPNPTKSRLGESCTIGVDTCASGFCVDGVCCASACTDGCSTCNGITPGTCTPAQAGTNPHTFCTIDSANPCGTDGTCDGAGACRTAPAGKTCADPTCSNGSFVATSTCDGAGTCDTPTARACAPYACNSTGNACATICTPSAGCASNVTCTSGSCGKVTQGGRCFGGTDCTGGLCIDGFCCDTTCDGMCQSCKEPGHEGTCTKTVAGGIDPHGVCMDQGAASCGHDGRCDGMGDCQTYAAGTICEKGGCSTDGTKFMATSVCKGDGSACPPSTPVECGPYVCETDGAPGCAVDCGECTYYSSNMPPLAKSCASGATCENHCLDAAAAFTCE